MIKHCKCRSIYHLLSCLTVCSLLLTGCAETTDSVQSLQTETEQFVSRYFKEIKEDPSVLKDPTSQENPYHIFPKENIDDSYSCNILKFAAKKADYDIVSVQQKDNTHIDIDMMVSARSIGDILVSDTFFSAYLAKSVVMSENQSGWDNYYSAVTELFRECMKEQTVCVVETPVTLHLVNEYGWKVSDSENLLNALSGDIESYQNELTEKYDSLPVYIMEAETTEITTNTATEMISAEIQPSDADKDTAEETALPELPDEDSTGNVSPEENQTESETTERIYPPLIYRAEDNLYFEDLLIPNVTESENLPKSNLTTRTTRKKPVAAGEESYYDNKDYFASSGRYSAWIRTGAIYFDSFAEEILKENQERYSLKQGEGIIVIQMQITLDENLSGQDSITIPYYDFDLIDYQNTPLPSVKLTHLNTSVSLDEGQQEDIYLCYKYKQGQPFHLCYKEASDNTIWFQIIQSQ